MSRFLKVMIALLAVAIFAAPAMAQIKLNGYLRIQGQMDNYTANGLSQTDDTTSSLWNQRLRLKMSDTLNENVTLVYYAEADTDWGQQGKGGIGGGAKLGTDGVLLETKNAYADLNFDTFTARVGLQGFSDGFDSLFLDDDAAGVTVKSKMGMADLTLLYSKFSEGIASVYDDYDFYGLKVAFQPSDQLNFGVNTYYVTNYKVDTDLLILGVTGGVQLSDALALDGFFVYTDQSSDISANEGNSWMANVALKANLGNSGKIKFRVFYAPSDDDANDDNNVPVLSQFGFADENLMIVGQDAPATNFDAGFHYVDALNEGYGLLAVIVSGQYSLPESAYLKYGAGYFAADDDTINGDATASKDGTDLGTELALTVGKVFLGNVDLSLRGGYLFTGDFYGTDAEDAWKAISMLNISF